MQLGLSSGWHVNQGDIGRTSNKKLGLDPVFFMSLLQHKNNEVLGFFFIASQFWWLFITIHFVSIWSLLLTAIEHAGLEEQIQEPMRRVEQP